MPAARRLHSAPAQPPRRRGHAHFATSPKSLRPIDPSPTQTGPTGTPSHAEDLDLDSLDGSELVVAVEREFKESSVKIQEEQARKMLRLKDVYNYIEDALAVRS